MVSRFGHRVLDRPLGLRAGHDRPTQSKEDVGVPLILRSWFIEDRLVSAIPTGPLRRSVWELDLRDGSGSSRAADQRW